MSKAPPDRMTVGSVEEANALNLYALTTNSPAKGAAATAASTPVNIASDQIVPVKEADGANVTLGSKSDTAGANAAVANQTAQSRLSGIWTVLGSLTDAAATVWDNTSNSISSLLRGIGGYLKSIVAAVTAPGGTPTAVVNVQGSKQAQFISAIVHETGKTLNAEDVIGPITTPLDAVIPAIVPVAAQPFRILQARLEIDSIVATVLASQIDVILYNDAAAVTPIAGNAQNSQLYANGIKRLGRIQFGPFYTSGTGASTMSASYGLLQEGKAAFTDLFPVAQAISWRCVNKVTGTILATGQNVRLILDVCYQ
jgi:hypothetical protein